MWAHRLAVACDCGPFGTGTGKFGHPGQVPGVVTGCGVWSSVSICVSSWASWADQRGLAMTGGWLSCAMRSVTLRRTGKYTEWKSVWAGWGPGPVVANAAGHQGEVGAVACCGMLPGRAQCPCGSRRASGQVPERGIPVGVESIEMGAGMVVCSIGVPQMIPL